MNETAKQAARRLSASTLRAGFKPVALHNYTDVEGQTIYWRIRAKNPITGEKWIRPMKLNGRGYEIGEPTFTDGKPLYALHRIVSNPDAVIWIVEGEQKADALNKLGLVATTSGGATSAAATDWTPLRGHTVRIWPDHDRAGKSYAGEVAALLLEMDCAVSCVDVEKIGVADKGDVIDWLCTRQDATGGDIEKLPILTANQAPEAGTGAGSEPQEWPTLDTQARHGLAGEIVRAIEPNTESDPAAILIQTLLAFGAYIGRGPHVAVEGDQHHGNLFALLVGNTSKGRKGTSWGRVRQVFERLFNWVKTVSGLSSGEGLKWNVRDPAEGKEGTDPGVSDKRLLVVESEFAQALRATARNGSTLSATIREAWDTGNLRTLTKSDPIVASGAYVAIIGHITVTELRAELTQTDRGNGFANRFLFVCVKRSKVLPFGGDAINEALMGDLVLRLKSAADSARKHGGAVGMSGAARAMWKRVYPELSLGLDGMLGAVTGRAEAQCLRLALLYALLDEQTEIDEPHLLAAIALWEYCQQSARFIFGGVIGNPQADKILGALQAAGERGLTRTAIRDLFKRHESTERISAALDLLEQRNLAYVEKLPTDGGRPSELWRAGVATKAIEATKASDDVREGDLMSHMSLMSQGAGG